MGGTDLLGSRPRWRGAREVIDWTMTGKRIFTRTKPLRPNTLRRILAGAVKYYWPRPYTEAVQPLLDDQAPRLVFSRAKAVALGLVSADALMVHLRGTSEQHLQATAKSADEPLPTSLCPRSPPAAATSGWCWPPAAAAQRAIWTSRSPP